MQHQEQESGSAGNLGNVSSRFILAQKPGKKEVSFRAREQGLEVTLDQWWTRVSGQRPLRWDNSRFCTILGLPGGMGSSQQQ